MCTLGGGEGRGFLVGISRFLVRDKGCYQKFWEKKAGLLICFSPVIKNLISKHCFVNFFIKEDYLNYSMLKESLLAYLLDKYILYRTLTINITVKCFYSKAKCFRVNDNYNISMKSSIFL